MRRGYGILLLMTTAARISALLFLTVSLSPAEDGSAYFENHIRPILVERCYSCHSEESGKQKGGLLLDRRSGWETGGDSGPALIPHKPEDSLIITAVHYTDEHLKMPPKSKLPAEELERLA
ncbi:MAG: c-type cytochrome domain-containing protein, partial [Verrucomicrobiota bacterium]